MSTAEKIENFEAFLNCWEALPRDHHPFLPAKSACTPVTLGALLPQSGIFEYCGKFDLRIRFIGSELERLSGIRVGDTQEGNYYSLLPDEFKPMMHGYHKAVFGTPCGAYVGDVLTTKAGSSYLFETMQFPLCDDKGDVRYLLAYGYGRVPTGDLGGRDVHDRTQAHIRDLHYMDLGGGAPSSCIINFEVRL